MRLSALSPQSPVKFRGGSDDGTKAEVRAVIQRLEEGMDLKQRKQELLDKSAAGTGLTKAESYELRRVWFIVNTDWDKARRTAILKLKDYIEETTEAEKGELHQLTIENPLPQ